MAVEQGKGYPLLKKTDALVVMDKETGYKFPQQKPSFSLAEMVLYSMRGPGVVTSDLPVTIKHEESGISLTINPPDERGIRSAQEYYPPNIKEFKDREEKARLLAREYDRRKEDRNRNIGSQILGLLEDAGTWLRTGKVVKIDSSGNVISKTEGRIFRTSFDWVIVDVMTGNRFIR